MTNPTPGETSPSKREAQVEAMKKLFERTPEEVAAHKTYWDKWTADMEDAQRFLEAKYESRGLEFTSGFEGAVPVQAYGYVDGMRFYFRFRGNVSSLSIGPFDADYEKRYAHFSNYRDAEQNTKREKEGLPPLSRSSNHPQTEDDPRFYPHVIYRYGGASGKDSGDIYNGSFSDGDDAIWQFSQTMDAVEDVPVEERYSSWDRENLYPEGVPGE